MATGTRHIRIKPITLVHQLSDLRKRCAGFDGSISKNVLVVTGSFRPSPVSVAYTVRITLPFGACPKVIVENPELQKKDGKPCPHLFRDGSLCLFFPKYRQWTADSYLSETIVPWTKLWLYFYEVWLLTSEWLGGGVHPGNADPDSSNS